MPTIDINDFTKKVQTLAEWEADLTVYDSGMFLISSNDYYYATDQRKFKIANGVDIWEDLDDMPIGVAELLSSALQAELDGKVAKSDFNTAHSLLVQQTGTGTPEVLTLSDNEILGKVGGSLDGLSASQVRTIINVEDGADVTDPTNVDAAGAVMETDTSTASMQFVVDEDDMVSDSPTKVPTQQSVKAYVDAQSNNTINITSSSGWGDYTDTRYTTGSPFSLAVADGQVELPNNSGTIRNSEKPSDIQEFYYSVKLNVTGVSGTFVVGETITGGTSGATGVIGDVQASYLMLNTVSNTAFSASETITGGTSSATATVDGSPEEGRISGKNGDAYLVVIEFKVRPTSPASNVRVQAVIDIGGAVGEIYPRDFTLTKGNGVEHYYLSSFGYYTLDTFEANGGIVKVQAFNDDLEIYDIRLVFERTHKAGNEYVQTNSITSDMYAGILNSDTPSSSNPFLTETSGQKKASRQTLTDGATVDWDVSNGNVASLTLGGNRTINAPTNLYDDSFTIFLIQDGTGSRTVTWNSIFKWSEGTAPTLSTAAGAIDIITFVYDGTNLYGTGLTNFS